MVTAGGKPEASAQGTRPRESFSDTSPPPASHGTVTPTSLRHCGAFYNLHAQHAFPSRSHMGVSRAHLPGLVVVLYLAQVPAAGLRNPLPRHQVPHHHRGRADFCKETATRVWGKRRQPPKRGARLGEELARAPPGASSWHPQCFPILSLGLYACLTFDDEKLGGCTLTNLRVSRVLAVKFGNYDHGFLRNFLPLRERRQTARVDCVCFSRLNVSRTAEGTRC